MAFYEGRKITNNEANASSLDSRESMNRKNTQSITTKNNGKPIQPGGRKTPLDSKTLAYADQAKSSAVQNTLGLNPKMKKAMNGNTQRLIDNSKPSII